MECVLCGEPVTNPISQERLQQHVRAWLQEERPELMEEAEVAQLFASLPTATQCIVTQDAIKACPFCFAKEVWAVLETKAPELMESHDRLFNYGIYPQTAFHVK